MAVHSLFNAIALRRGGDGVSDAARRPRRGAGIRSPGRRGLPRGGDAVAPRPQGDDVRPSGRLRRSPEPEGETARGFASGAETTLIAGTDLHADGAYRFTVSLGRPGPFHTTYGTVSSNPITVRIYPRLVTSLAGKRLAGSPLAFRARLEPKEAGTLRVRVIRSGKETYRGGFAGHARVKLATQNLDPFEVRAESLPAKGYEPVSKNVRVALRAPALTYGSTSPLVAGARPPPRRSRLRGAQRADGVRLRRARGRLRVREGAEAAANRRRRHRLLEPARAPGRDHAALHVSRRTTSRSTSSGRSSSSCATGRWRWSSPVSTAGIAGYYTPVGRFAIGRKINGYDTSPLGVLYKPMYFYGGYAIHGNPSVPPYPASHGCVRVPNFVIDRLFVSRAVRRGRDRLQLRPEASAATPLPLPAPRTRPASPARGTP